MEVTGQPTASSPAIRSQFQDQQVTTALLRLPT